MKPMLRAAAVSTAPISPKSTTDPMPSTCCRTNIAPSTTTIQGSVAMSSRHVAIGPLAEDQWTPPRSVIARMTSASPTTPMT